MLWLRFFARPFIAPPKVEPILTDVFTTGTATGAGAATGVAVVTGIPAATGAAAGVAVVNGIGAVPGIGIGSSAGSSTLTGLSASTGSSAGVGTLEAIMAATGAAAGKATLFGAGISVTQIITSRDILQNPVDFVLAGDIVGERPRGVSSIVDQHIFNE